MIQPKPNILGIDNPIMQEDIDTLASICPEYKKIILEMYPEKYGDK